MIRTKVVPITAVVCCVLAAYVSSNLLEKHISGSSGVSWFEAGCSEDDEAGGADCAKVLASPYSYFPAKRPDPAPRHQHNHAPPAADRTPRVPVAFLGLVYYSGLAVWFIGIGRPSPSKRWLHALPLAVIVLGLLGSGYYTFIMFTRLNEWCPWCMVTHALNVCIAGCAFVMTPSTQPQTNGDSAPSRHATKKELRRTRHTAHAGGGQMAQALLDRPSGRLVLITCLAIGFVSYANLSRLGLKTWRQRALTSNKEILRYQAVINRFKDDPTRLVRHWRHAERFSFDVGDDAPVRTDANPGEFSWQVVMFSDLACPSCKRIGQYLEQRAQPLFGGRLKIAFKHYPLHRDCNGHTKTKMHPHACSGAAMVEAARILGGNSAFWDAHDFIFARQNLLKRGSLTADQVATHLGLDPATFAQAMLSENAAARIARDVDTAVKCKITGTPSVFVEGRKAETLAVSTPAFWEALATMFWKASGEARPADTRPRSATPAKPGTGN